MTTDQDSMSWSELAQLTHATQVERFNWCMCEDNEGQENPYNDCPKEAEMKRYLFNVQNTYVVIAESETQAQEMLDNGKAELKDRDTLLVEVTDDE